MKGIPASLLLLLAATAAVAGDPVDIEIDDQADSCWRRTDPGADGPIDPGQVRPELRSIAFSKWSATTPFTNPFIGTASDNARDLFRIDLVIQGLVNPPGELYDQNNPLAPFQFGPSPLISVVEINVDRRAANDGRDTGGDLTFEAGGRYLANAARFGGRPGDSDLAGRVVERPGDLDGDFFTSPQFERSGAEFVFKLCGCEPITVLDTSVPGDTQFSEGDTWLVQGHFFERTSGLSGVSLMTCPPQRYSPLVRVRFAHHVGTDQTTVSLVYALTQEGARQLAGLTSVPPINDRVGCDANEGSMSEALADVIAGAAAAASVGWWTVDLPTRAMSEGWLDRTSLTPYLDPTEWRSTVLVGTTYSRTAVGPSADGAEFIWTDCSDTRRGDLDGNGAAAAADRMALEAFIAAHDAADGTPDGRVVTPGFAADFHMQDLNYDGCVDCTDVAVLGGNPCCPGDWNRDGALGVQDLFEFLSDWFAGAADFNSSGGTSLQDLFDYLIAYFAGC